MQPVYVYTYRGGSLIESFLCLNNYDRRSRKLDRSKKLIVVYRGVDFTRRIQEVRQFVTQPCVITMVTQSVSAPLPPEPHALTPLEIDRAHHRHATQNSNFQKTRNNLTASITAQ